jgi:hypothetical protein
MQSLNLSCSLCKKPFNLNSREPINLKCCDEIACRNCVESKMIKTKNKDVVIKGQFECSFCSADHCAPEGFIQPIKIAANKHVRK